MCNDQTNLIQRFSSTCITSIGWQLCMKGKVTTYGKSDCVDLIFSDNLEYASRLFVPYNMYLFNPLEQDFL